MIDSKPYTIKFISKQELTKDTFTFAFERPNDFAFLPGQYNRWTLPIEATDKRGSSRYFTISSSPSDIDTLTVTTKIIQSDFKKALLNLKKNDEIKIFGPMGNFILDETTSKPRVLIAGGIGITPYHSMLTYAAAKKLTIPLTLLVSFSMPEEMVFYDELKKLESYPNIKIIYTITKPEESQTPWTGEKGRISEELIKKYVSDITNSLFYVVGPPPMEEATTKILKGMQIAEENILTEAFTGY
jgi:ferredoxin-NADP reductase